MGKHRTPEKEPDPVRPIKKGRPSPPETTPPPEKKPSILPWRKR